MKPYKKLMTPVHTYTELLHSRLRLGDHINACQNNLQLLLIVCWVVVWWRILIIMATSWSGESSIIIVANIMIMVNTVAHDDGELGHTM